MEQIILITGNVKHTITIDPGVWIFDDRKVDLTSYFDTTVIEEDELTKYKKDVSAHWDRELLEGVIPPSERKKDSMLTKKERILTGTFGMPFKPFLQNAEILENAKTLIIERNDDLDSIEVTIATAEQFILGFSNKGKPLREDGPVHVYFGDGSNKAKPITHVSKFVIT